MFKRRPSFSQLSANFSSSQISEPRETSALHCIPSDITSRVHPLMTRDNTITCKSTASSNRRTTRCRPRLLTVQPIDGFEDSEDGSCEETEGDSETSMKACPLTAHTFRITQYLQELEIIDNLPADHHNSLVEQPRPMCIPTLITSESNNASARPRRNERGTSELCDMLCNVTPSIIELATEDETGHEVLYHHWRTPHTIVIDSHIPDLAPHIVITPPPDSWDVLSIGENNRVNYQTPWSLTVPPLSLLTSRMHKYEEWTSLFHQPPLPQIPPTSAISPLTHEPPRVFNGARFQLLVKRTENERLYHFTRELHLVNHRRLYKVAAIAASLRAQELHLHYTDSSEFLDSTEKFYRWSDPADPLLSAFERCRDTHIIYSVNPFGAPHIVIQVSGPNDPWVVWNNSTNCQDLAFGNSLGVFSSRRAPLTYSNVANYDSGDAVDVPWDDEDCSSSSDSSRPQTPSGLDMLGDEFLFEEDITECPSYLEYSECASAVPEDIPAPKSKATFFILDEDEDDGPPEFDDWYISIAQRAQEAGDAEMEAHSVMTAPYR